LSATSHPFFAKAEIDESFYYPKLILVKRRNGVGSKTIFLGILKKGLVYPKIIPDA